MQNSSSDLICLGYKALIELYSLNAIPHYLCSYIHMHLHERKVEKKNGFEIQYFPLAALTFDLKDSCEQLMFAIKFEGINIGILKCLFEKMPKDPLVNFIGKHKHSIHARKIWYLYELLTDSICKLSDLLDDEYAELIDSEEYYTAIPVKSKRHRILDNLLGSKEFCPMVRKTQILQSFQDKELERVGDLLYNEHQNVVFQPIFWKYGSLNPGQQSEALERHERLVKFVDAVDSYKKLDIQTIIDIHNQLVLPKFREVHFREHQNYLAYDKDDAEHPEKLVRISPKPEDVEVLMRGLMATYHKLQASRLHPVVQAGVISFGLSIIHPFADGNGRVQLGLIYQILFNSKFRSAARIFCRTLSKFFYMPGFNQAVSSFDHSLLPLMHFTLHSNETLAVHGETIDFYRYIDYTPMVEFMFSWVEEQLDYFRNSIR